MMAAATTALLCVAFTGPVRMQPKASQVSMLFGKSDAQKRAIDEQWEYQQQMLNNRRNPAARKKYFADIESRREKESAAWKDKLAWQRRADSASFNKLDEFKRRKAAGSVKKLGYEDTPRGGIQLPMASFGVGGEFGVGGKYDNGERFDLRLPYVDDGWVEDKSGKKAGGKRGPGKRGGPAPSAKPGSKPGPFDWLFGK